MADCFPCVRVDGAVGLAPLGIDRLGAEVRVGGAHARLGGRALAHELPGAAGLGALHGAALRVLQGESVGSGQATLKNGEA